MNIIKIPFSILLCAAIFTATARSAGALDQTKAQAAKAAGSNAQPQAVVSIPDPALNKYLHGKTGIAMSKPIRRQDLAALTGKLDPKGKGIVNAEGIQYCTGIDELDMTGNRLADMPDLAMMEKLKVLNLSGNKFTSVPEGVCHTPNLETLNMEKNALSSLPAAFSGLARLKSLFLSGNKLTAFPGVLTLLAVETLDISDNTIGSLPEDISGMRGLRSLTAANCGITALPATFYDMGRLQKVDLSGNMIGTLSKSIKNLGSLEAVYLNDNTLVSLPGEICALSKLKVLSLNGNGLSALPSKIGDLKLTELYANKNNMTSIPGSLAEISTLKTLDLRLNRLKKLPSGLGKTGFDHIDVEWNFLDMSEGSSARKMMSVINAAQGCLYLRQLTPLNNTTASSTPESVTLNWDKCESGDDGTAAWTVMGYTVYAVENETAAKAAEALPAETASTLTGLLPSTIYTYRIGVEYKVSDRTAVFEGTSRNYTEIEVRTAASDTPVESTAPPSVTPEVTIESVPLPSLSTAPPAAAATLYGGETRQGDNMLLYVIMAGVSVIAVSAIVLVIIVLVKKKPDKD